MNDFKPKHLKWDTIRKVAENVREKYVTPVDQIPVPIEEILEFKLGFSIEPEWQLRDRTDAEAILLGDLKTIKIDNHCYFNEHLVKRLRFTLAHELGHFFLHNQEIQSFRFNSIEDWINFRKSIDEDDLEWFEKQANEFAGRLLVPRESLFNKILERKEGFKKIYNSFTKDNEDDNPKEVEGAILLAFARSISDIYMVSPDVIKRRIKSEFDWPAIKADLLI